MSWPTNTDIVAFLAANQIVMPDGSAISTTQVTAARVAAAVKRFELLTGWIPFEGVTETRTFDPPGLNAGYLATPRGGGRMLSLGAGLISITSVQVQNATLTQGQHYWPKRLGPDSSRPYEVIEFLTPIIGLPQSISITGTWGRMAAADDLAKEAVTKLAAAMVLSGVRESFSQIGDVEWKEADVSERGSIELYKTIGKTFEDEAAAIAQIYERKTVGL